MLNNENGFERYKRLEPVTNIKRVSYQGDRNVKKVPEIRTQFARIQRNQFSQLKSNRSQSETSLNKLHSVQYCKDQFVNKSDKEFNNQNIERENSPKIPEILSELKSPQQLPHSKISENVFAGADIKLLKENLFQRSKSDLNTNRSNLTTSHRSIRSIPKKRSKSNQPLQTDISSKESPKKRSYSQEDARRYIEEQKKKRSMCKNVSQADKNKIKLDKEEIKKRLQELQKNTRKIISKNLQKKQKKTETIAPNITHTIGIHGNLNEGSIKFRKPIDRKKFHKNEYMNKIENIETDEKKLKTNNTKLEEISDQCKPTSITNERKDDHIKKNEKPKVNATRKHIGLLRKPEQKDYSFGVINESRYNKESDALEKLTPHLSTPQNECRTEKVQIDKRRQEHIEEDGQDINIKSNSHTLEIPPVQLKPIDSKTKSVEVQVSATETHLNAVMGQNNKKAVEKEQSDLPYWLKPSAVQIYPYNFIMAVRRKLEAITRTPQAHITEYTQTNSTHNKITSTRDLILSQELDSKTNSIPNSVIKEYSKIDTIDMKPQSNTALDVNVQPANYTPRNTMCLVNELMKSAQTITEDSLKSKSISELNVKTLSSISINMSSNNISEICYKSNYHHESLDAEMKSKPSQRQVELKSNGIRDDDDTTVSSSIFNSPKKGAHVKTEDTKSTSEVSPLSLENVEQLKISSRISKSFESKTSKTSDSDSTETASYHLQQYKPKQLFNDQTEVNMNELLSDFNRSLTQVIEVNEQLKSTIDKSYQIFNSYDTTKRSTPRTASSDNYSTDFEGSTKENLLSEMNKITELSKSSEMTEKNVKEKSQYEDELTVSLNSKSKYQSSQRSNKKCIVPILVIDSLSNSSDFSKNSNETINSLVDHNDGTEKEEKISLQYEEQLKAIEQLKSDLKQTIVDSVACRNNFKSICNKPLTTSNTSDSSRVTSDKKLKRKNYSTETSKKMLNSLNFDESPKSTNTISTNKNVENLLSHSENNSVKNKEQTKSTINESTPKTQNLTGSFSSKNKKFIKTKKTFNILNEDMKQDHDFSNKEYGDENNSNSIWKSTHSNRSHNNTTDKIRENLIKTNVNTTRGEYQGQHFTDMLKEEQFNTQDETKSFLLRFTTTSLIEKSSEDTSSPSATSQDYKSTNKRTTSTASIKTKSVKSIGNELLKIFNKSDLDISIISSNRSETSLNYSNFGLYEKVIKNETSKSEHLAALLKMREKALLDRAKSQIALLEVQKEKYKSRGLVMELSAIKKKQRAILIKMEKEREEIKRLIQTVSSTSFENAFHPTEAYTIPSVDGFQCTDKVQKRLSPLAAVSIRSIQQKKGQDTNGTPTATHSAPIIRGNYHLEFSPVLEDLLKKREEDLRKRREHVQNLIQWHQRLDQEEAEVLELERLLLKCNNAQPNTLQTTNTDTDTTAIYLNNIIGNKVSDKKENTSNKQTESKRSKKMERHLKEIENSLRELNTLSSSSTAVQNDINSSTESVDYVRISGHKLNKLWRRLTSQQIDKFEPCKRYKVCKTDLEKIYEEAKIAVLHDFAQDEERIAVDLLERSDTERSINKSTNGSEISYSAGGTIKVPPLNLSPSTVPSSCSESNSGESQLLTKTDISESETETETNKFKNNIKPIVVMQEKYVQKLKELSERNILPHAGLHRSLSDTQIPMLTIVQPFATTNQQLSLNNSKTLKENPTLNECAEVLETQQIKESIKSVNASPETPLKKLSETREYINIPAEHLNVDATSSTSISNNSDTTIKTSELSNDEDIFSPFSEGTSSSSNDLLKKVRKYTAYAKNSENNISLLPHAETINQQIKNDSFKHSIEKPHTTFDAMNLELNSKLNTREQDKCDKLLETPSVSELLSLHSQEVSTTLKTDIVSSKNSSPQQMPDMSPNLKEISSSISQLLESNSFPPTELTTKESSGSVILEKEKSESSICTQHNLSSDTSSVKSDNESQHINELSNDKLYTSTSALKRYEEQLLNEVKNKNQKDYEYESDFEAGSDETKIEDISMPQIETTFDVTLSNSFEENKTVSNNNCSLPAPPNDNKAELLPPPPPPLSLSPSPSPISSNSTASCNSQLMPDIINELEVRRCQQINAENDFEQVASVSYMYMREIPNKPPPPYVPPAHGSPMTTIFPSEERIKDITYRRTHELYCEYLKTDYISENGEKLSLLIDEKITNIYERIIIDICREYIEEHKEVLMQGDPKNFHSNLAFFNPPDRLRCLQNNIYKEVRRCLAMDKASPKRAHVYSVYGQRAKRDDIGKIIIQEMYDEDDKWCNSHREEYEVINLIVEEMLLNNIRQIAKEVFHEEGGKIEENTKVLEKSNIIDETDVDLDERISTNVKDGKHCKTDNSNIVS
ncbi:uncharacterized protein LOC119686195 isoform X2 [Teleopsis dalmanni]|uniref:uncharacterized protein LOC119686195 isoform X2 n=1 Tax=Teleopsis dalmanni TaxID=139649 RepID=UPI0018CE1545|nr:uncharacterized protein LOC119686195 isoform X2 [Teleopsis dalmanni]